jgi:hypothetical protein
VLRRLEDYAELRYGRVVVDPATTAAVVRTRALDQLLMLCHHDPHTWRLTDRNSREDNRHFYVDLDVQP